MAYPDGSGSKSSILIVQQGEDVYAEMIPDPAVWSNLTEEQKNLKNLMRSMTSSRKTYKHVIRKRNRLKNENSDRIWIRKLTKNQYKKLKNILKNAVVYVGKNWENSGYTYTIDITILDFPEMDEGHYCVRGESFIKKQKGKRDSNYFIEFKNSVFKEDIKRAKAERKKRAKIKVEE